MATDAERLSALKRLPRTLESTYDSILERVIDRGDSVCTLVQRSLIWIVSGQRLGIRELCEAVSIDVHATFLDPRKLIDVDEILISCSSLVRASVEDAYLESAHFTVVEYLRGIDPTHRPHLARFRINDEIMYSHMAETCLTALTFDNITADAVRDFASLVHWHHGFPFYYHAATSWVGHDSHCQRTASIAALTQKLFLGHEAGPYQVWVHVYLLRWQQYRRGSSDITAILDSKDHVDSVTELQYTSEWTRALGIAAKWSRLRFAACLSQEHIVREIFESTETLDDAGSVGTPLHLAMLGVGAFEIQMNSLDLFTYHCTWRRDDASSSTVKTLLDLGADINVKYPLPDGKQVATILIAFMTGHIKEAIAAGASLDKEAADWLYIHGDKKELEPITSIDANTIIECDRSSVIRLQRKCGRSSGITSCEFSSYSASFTDAQNEFLPEYVKLLEEAGSDDDLTVVQWVFETSRVPFDKLINGRTMLHVACFHSSALIVAYLIAQGAQIDKVAASGETPLGSLLSHTSEPDPSTVTIMRSLLEAGANICALDEENNSSLTFWARKICLGAPSSTFQDVLNIILSSQRDLLRVNVTGWGVWHALAANPDGHHLFPMLEAVISREELRASVDLADQKGWTPLHVAITECQGRMMQLLIDAGSSLTSKAPGDRTVLDLATEVLNQSHIPFRILFEAVCKAAQEESQSLLSGTTIPDPIMTIVQTGDLDRLKSFVAAGGDLDSRFKSCNCTPATAALVAAQVAVFEYLQSRGVRLDTMFCRLHHPEGLSVLGLLAAQRSMLRPLQTTLASVENLTMHNFTHMMHSAAANGNLEALRLMIDAKQRLRLANSGRHIMPPICRIWGSGQTTLVRESETILHTAVQSGQRGSVQILLENGFEPDAVDSVGPPPSHIAAQQGRDDILELLLSHGGDVNARDAHLFTTLGSAVVTGHMNVIRPLLNRGADPSAKDYQGQSLFQVASRNRNSALFFALMEVGLDPALEDIHSWYKTGSQKQILMARNHMDRLVVKSDFLLPWGVTLPEMRAVLNVVPSHYRKLNLTCRCRVGEVCYTALYNASIAGFFAIAKLLHDADAMLNLEGGLEGTPLMGACKAGRLEVAKYLVRNGAILNYAKNGVQVSAFLKAASYPKIQRWLLVERFTEQRTIIDGETSSEQTADVEDDETWTDEIADVTLDLVLEDDVEMYLESKNWFLPMRRFVDDGQGAFVRVPIMPEEFARYRPLDFKVSST